MSDFNAKKTMLRRHFVFRGSLLERSLDTAARWAEWNRTTPGCVGGFARLFLWATGSSRAPDKFRCAELLRKAFADTGVTDQSFFPKHGS